MGESLRLIFYHNGQSRWKAHRHGVCIGWEHPGGGINDKEFVRIDFNRGVTLTEQISPQNIDEVLSLSNGHTWLPCELYWNVDSTSLAILFHPALDTPNVSIGDTVCPDGVTIRDSRGRFLYEPFVIEKSLGIEDGTDYRLSVYPNPARGKIVIQYEVSSKQYGDNSKELPTIYCLLSVSTTYRAGL